jgi:hypothetical protein
MRKEEWRTERVELQRILDDLESGKIILENGKEEYVTSVKRRIANLDDKITRQV